jgi:hypothetical protein
MLYHRVCADANTNVPELVIDKDGYQLLCEYTTLPNLIARVDGITEVSAVKLGGELSTSMKKFVDYLCALASKHSHMIEGDELPFHHACCATSEAYNEAVASSKMHVLSGLSRDASKLFVVFAPISVWACIVRAELE